MLELKVFPIAYKSMDLKIAANFEQTGTEWLLLLHGIQSNKKLFDELLSQSFVTKYSLLAIDLVGFGQSTKPEQFSYDINEQANIIDMIVKRLRISKLHIIGHSLGGMVATLLLNRLQNIQSFINMEGNLALEDCGLSKEVISHSFDSFQKSQYKAIKSTINNADRAKWVEEIPDFVFYKTSQSIIDWASSGKLLQTFANASCRTLFIHGADNSAKFSHLSKEIEKKPIPNAGHFMLQDNPEVCCRSIQQFVLANSSLAN